MAKAAVAIAAKVMVTQKASEVRDRAKQPYNPNMVADVYLKTSTGVVMLIGRDGDEVREHIEQDKEHSPLDYRFYDDDKRRWAYWAIRDRDGTIRPPTFPNPIGYSLTSLQLYTKAVTYSHILAHAVGLLKDKPATLWDKMLKPTTIIIAIVGIVFVMGLMLMALTG
jgi:hypothetical protein